MWLKYNLLYIATQISLYWQTTFLITRSPISPVQRQLVNKQSIILSLSVRWDQIISYHPREYYWNASLPSGHRNFSAVLILPVSCLAIVHCERSHFCLKKRVPHTVLLVNTALLSIMALLSDSRRTRNLRHETRNDPRADNGTTRSNETGKPE